MKRSTPAREVIRALEEGNFSATCGCGESFKLRDAGLFHLKEFTPEAEEIYRQKLAEIKERRKELRELRSKIKAKSELQGRTVNVGSLLERMVLSLKTFTFDRNDCRSIFKPIDYVIFEGLSRLDRVSRLIFTEIKSGEARLNEVQREVRDLVGKHKIEWATYRTGEDK